MLRTTFTLPNLVRIKPGALARLGVYLRRHGHLRVVLLETAELSPPLVAMVEASLRIEGVSVRDLCAITENTFDAALALFQGLQCGTDAIVGVGGGKALDVAKYVAFLAKLPYYAVPTSLSNDGFCSPQSSLVMEGRRRSLSASLPFAVVVDTEVCLEAPELLWLSGVGDLVAKITAVRDWKLAFHAVGTPIDDFAALLSDATVYQFIANPARDQEGVRTLATALMLNGVAIEIAGTSRPASGSEHLISHALDAIGARPRLHGLQVGVATYIVSRLQGYETERVASVLSRTGFFAAVARDPFSRATFLEAARKAPKIKEGYYTILSSRDCLPEITAMLDEDGLLRGCFV